MVIAGGPTSAVVAEAPNVAIGAADPYQIAAGSSLTPTAHLCAVAYLHLLPLHDALDCDIS